MSEAMDDLVLDSPEEIIAESIIIAPHSVALGEVGYSVPGRDFDTIALVFKGINLNSSRDTVTFVFGDLDNVKSMIKSLNEQITEYEAVNGDPTKL